jgi:hypothetical protein
MQFTGMSWWTGNEAGGQIQEGNGVQGGTSGCGSGSQLCQQERTGALLGNGPSFPRARRPLPRLAPCQGIPSSPLQTCNTYWRRNCSKCRQSKFLCRRMACSLQMKVPLLMCVQVSGLNVRVISDVCMVLSLVISLKRSVLMCVKGMPCLSVLA